MAKDIITRFKLETSQYDSKIKSAAKELSDFTKTATQAKEGFNQFTQANVDAARALGSMATSTTNAKTRAQELVGAYNDLVRVYNHLTQEQQQSDFGKAMADSMRELQQRIKDVKQEIQDVKTDGGLFGSKKLDGMLQVFGGNLMTKGASMLAGFASEMGDMVKQGIELAKQGEGIRLAFERLGRGDILEGLRQATHGTVSDLELMKAAVKFNDFKLPVEELGTMLAFAQQKAKDTGQSVDYMVDSIVTGLGRKSLMILDNLGLSAAEIKERMKETGDMTKAVGEIIRDQMAAAGDYVETAADRAQQATVSLQNKMEELGRKFQPLQEASNTFWTSVKVSILDIVGGPLAQFLNGLTEAGRQMQMLNNLQGVDTGKPTRVESQLSALRGSNFKNDKYRSQLNHYDQDIRVAEYFKKKYQEAGWAGGSVLSDITRRFKVNVTGVEDIDNLITSLKTMRSEYQKGAKEIIKPVKPAVDTKQAEQSVASLKKRLTELEEQRKKAVKAGDQELVETITKEINQTKTNIGYLDPNAIKTTGTKTKTEDFTEIIGLIGNAQERITDLQKQIRESWDQNEITRLNQKLKDAQNELDVLQGKLPKDTVVDITVNADTADAIKKLGDIDGVTIDPKTFAITATDEALPLLREIEGITIDPKTFAITATDEALPLLREIEGVTIEPKTFAVTATDDALPLLREIEGVTIEPKTFAVTATDDALPLLREIEGITIDSKTLSITATNDALPLLRQVKGVTIAPKTFSVTATDEALPLLREIEGITIEPKTFSVTATDDALPLLREIEGVTIDPKTFSVTATDDALPLLQEIEGVTIDPKSVTVTADTTEALQRVQKLVADINGTIIDMKVVPVITDEDIERSMREQYGKPIEVPVVPKTAGEKLEMEVRTNLSDQNIETDMQTLRTILETQIKNGIDGIDIPSNLLIQQIMGEGIDIPDEYWQKLQDSINEKLKEMNIDTIDIDFKTGNLSKAEKKESPMEDGKKMLNAISQLTGGLQQMGIELPSEIQGVIGAIQGAMQVIEVVNTIIGVTQTTALTANTAAMISLEAALWANTATSLIPFANGGVVPGFANGGMIDSGHSPSFLSFSKAAPAFATGGVVPQTFTSMPKFATGGIVQKFNEGGTVEAGHAPDFLSFSKSMPKFATGGIIQKFNEGGTVDAGHAPDFLSFSKGVTKRFASGGTIPHANDGYFVGGTHFSSDVTPIMANAGELVLNKAQQGVIANQLQGGNNNNVENRQPYVNGELIYLGLNNYLKRTGRGEIVVSKR